MTPHKGLYKILVDTCNFRVGDIVKVFRLFPASKQCFCQLLKDPYMRDFVDYDELRPLTEEERMFHAL